MEGAVRRQNADRSRAPATRACLQRITLPAELKAVPSVKLLTTSGTALHAMSPERKPERLRWEITGHVKRCSPCCLAAPHGCTLAAHLAMTKVACLL